MEPLVIITRSARKGLEKAPHYIQDKLYLWIASVKHQGLDRVRQIPAFQDEPLLGSRLGQRSVRLNRQWRAIYTESRDHGILITLLEVTPHDYRTR